MKKHHPDEISEPSPLPQVPFILLFSHSYPRNLLES